jgi:hypothetical protein
MIFGGTRFAEIVRMDWGRWTRTNDFHEFILWVKNQKKLQRIRWFHLRKSLVDPFQALDELYAQESAKQQRLFNSTKPTGPIWTNSEGIPWSSVAPSAAVARVLRSAGLPFNKPHRIKAWTVTALRRAGVPLADIARFIRHSVSSGNLDRFYVVDDKGKACTQKLVQLAEDSHL